MTEEIKKEFKCPYCGKRLSNEKGIILNTLNLNNTTKGEIIFSATLGDYHHKEVSEELTLQDGDNLMFQCPHCAISLNLEKDPSKAVVVMDEAGKQSEIVFSAVVGEKFTYKLNSDKTASQFGIADTDVVPNLWDQFTW